MKSHASLKPNLVSVSTQLESTKPKVEDADCHQVMATLTEARLEWENTQLVTRETMTKMLTVSEVNNEGC